MRTVKGFCDTDEVNLYFETRGEGSCITLCNGTAMDTRVWDGQFSELSRCFRVVRYANRGSGRSGDTMGVPYRLQDDLKALMDHLRIEKTIASGVSVGGGIALNFALDHPDHVAGLILMDPFMTGYTWPHISPKMKTLAEHWKRKDVKQAAEVWYSMDWFSFLKKDEAKFERFKRIVDDNVIRFFSRPFPPMEDWGKPMTERLHQIHAPVLLLIGEHDTPDNREVVRIIEREVEGSTVVEGNYSAVHAGICMK